MSDRIAAALGLVLSVADAMILAIDPTLEPAVAEAKRNAARLHKAFYRGPGDTDEAVRYRVARLTGVPASYLLRLHKRAHEMTDVSGKWARLLKQACDALDEAAAPLARALDHAAERADDHAKALDAETDRVRFELGARAMAARRRPRQESFLQELESDRTLDRPHPKRER